MKWAFWRRDAAAAPTRDGSRRTARTDDDADPGRVDPATALKIRARRRLIGAAALLLAAVIVVPMVLDPAPRRVVDTVPIEIPSEKTPFTPRLPLPPVPDPAQLQGGPPPDATADRKADDTKAEPKDAKAADKTADKSVDKAGEKAARAAAADKAQDKPQEKSPDKPVAKPADKGDKTGDKTSDKAAADKADKAAEAQRARDILEGKTGALPKASKDGRFFVQAAAPRNEQSARDLAARLKAAGLPSFTERVQASDGPRYRVRVGPYASRADAERARARLRELGVGADLIAP
jgi:DedD protein